MRGQRGGAQRVLLSYKGAGGSCAAYNEGQEGHEGPARRCSNGATKLRGMRGQQGGAQRVLLSYLAEGPARRCSNGATKLRGMRGQRGGAQR
eukprot:1177447-Prorocentrum_minimum.AAC.2